MKLEVSLSRTTLVIVVTSNHHSESTLEMPSGFSPF